MRNQKEGIIFILVLLIVIFFQGCGGGSDGSQLGADAPYAPEESPRKTAYFRYPTPPEGFSAVLGWMQAINIYGTGEPSEVEVDWMRLHAVLNDGSDIVLLEDDFDNELPSYWYFGLYLRDPWFGDDDYHEPMPFLVEDSSLIISPNTDPDRVFHWWTDRVDVPEDVERIWLEARVRISGLCGVQAGIDYWRNLDAEWAGDNGNNIEAGASDWYGNSTTDWQVISVGKP